jgi:AN1-type zinc finger protein 5/6
MINTRCVVCKKKKVVQCKCNEYTCLAHRFSDQHSCSFDIKKEHKNKLTKQLPKVVGLKVEKI